MKAIDTAIKATATAGFTAAVFALPLALAMMWRSVPGIDEVQAVATPVVALAALPLAVVTEEGPEEIVAPVVEASGADSAKLEPTPRPQGAVRAPRSPRDGAPPSSASAPKEGKKGRKGKCGPGNAAIERAEAGTWDVQRTLVESYAKKPATLSSQGWAAAHEGGNGRNDGFRIGGISCGNDLHAAGFRNGDVVHSVNGKPVRNIPEALWAYATERKSDVIAIRITRQGSEKVLTYRMS